MKRLFLTLLCVGACASVFAQDPNATPDCGPRGYLIYYQDCSYVIMICNVVDCTTEACGRCFGSAHFDRGVLDGTQDGKIKVQWKLCGDGEVGECVASESACSCSNWVPFGVCDQQDSYYCEFPEMQ
jgi:hypothetical protein